MLLWLQGGEADRVSLWSLQGSETGRQDVIFSLPLSREEMKAGSYRFSHLNEKGVGVCLWLGSSQVYQQQSLHNTHCLFVCCCFYSLLVIGRDHQLMSHNDEHLDLYRIWREKKPIRWNKHFVVCIVQKANCITRTVIIYIVVVHLFEYGLCVCLLDVACSLLLLHARDKGVRGRTW